MALIPLSGPATYRVAVPPRDGLVVLSEGEGDHHRVLEMPIKAAIPVLTKALSDEVHPSVAMLAAAARFAMRLVAGGRVAQVTGGEFWHAVIEGRDIEIVRELAEARAHEGMTPQQAEILIRDLIDGVVDTVARTADPVLPRRRRVSTVSPTGYEEVPDDEPLEIRRFGSVVWTEHITDEEIAATIIPEGSAGGVLTGALGGALGGGEAFDDGLPTRVRVSMRVEADEGELVAGAVRLVAVVHDQLDPLHIVDAVDLWNQSSDEHGFGDGARDNTLAALRMAGEAWAPIGRFLDPAISGVPDQITLDGLEIADLLENGVEQLLKLNIDVLWPRALGSDLKAKAVVDAKRDDFPTEDALFDGLFTREALFAFNWQIALGDDPLTEEEMDDLAASASPILKLRGSYVVVPPHIARKARKRLLREVTATEALAVALTGELPGVELDDPPIIGASLMRLRDYVADAVNRTPVEVPEALKATLRDYQRQGLTWLAGLTDMGIGCCLADDMGLGKTITLIALHLYRQKNGHPGPTLVVCPTSLLGNWEAEVNKFAPGTPVVRFHGTGRELDALHDGFVLTTYGTMLRDATLLATVDWSLVVADEAQHVKNSESGTAKALRKIDKGSRVALTGTPVENDLTELWSILDWCIPGLLGSRQAFRRVWASQIEAGVDKRKAREFADLIAPFLLRRRKSDPGIAPELPPKTETDHLLALTKEQTVLYEAYVRDVMERIERLDNAEQTMRRGLVLQLLTGLKQICNHPAHFLHQAAGVIDGRSEKIDLLDELLETIRSEDGAALLFTQYVEMGRLLERHWTANGTPYQFLYGDTSVRQRERMVESFQNGEVPVFLLSLQAGGTGLNLTRADHVIHVDRWWNPAVEDQATDRAYRIGQTKPVQVHRLITHGTIEEKIAELLERKRALADAVLGRGEAALTELSNDELRDLVSLRR